MAIMDLEGYERACRLRSSADDDLLRHIFGADELDELMRTKPSLVETARSYFPHLTSSTNERLTREPETLKLEKDRCERDMEQLAVQNYSAFISSAKVTQSVRDDFLEIQNNLDALDKLIAPVQDGIRTFKEYSSGLCDRRRALRGVLQQERTIQVLLEIPQLLDSCTRAQMYNESLDLLASSTTMLQGYKARKEDIPVLDRLVEQINLQRGNLHNSLVGQLRTDIQMPKCVSIIGFLRRQQRHSEDELRRLFIEHRNAFLATHKEQVELQRNNRGSVVLALGKAAELLRTHVKDIGMQYRSLFGHQDGPLGPWLSQQVLWLSGLLRTHLLPPSREVSANSKSQSWQGVRAPVLGARIDATAVATILKQVLHASTTLKRLGGHFYPAVSPIFEVRMERIVGEMLDGALLTFHNEIGRYDWVPSTALVSSSAVETAELVDGYSWLHPQALDLTRHRPLAAFTNDLIQMFNELQQCPLVTLRAPVVRSCEECLLGAVNLLRSAKGSQTFHRASQEAVEFARMCQHLAHILVPFVASHLEAFFGLSVRMNNASIIKSMVPDLLSEAEADLGYLSDLALSTKLAEEGQTKASTETPPNEALTAAAPIVSAPACEDSSGHSLQLQQAPHQT